MKLNIKISFVILFLLTGNLFSQKKITIVDSITKEPLVYANIKFENNEGLYSDNDGSFKVIKEQNIIISYLGYHTIKINSSKIKDTIFMTPTEEKLNEVLIHFKKRKHKKIKFQKKPISFGFSILNTKSEIIVSTIPNDKIIGYNIDKVIISLEKLKWAKNKETLKKEYAIIRINIYDLIKGKPTNLLFSSTPIKINAYEKSKVELILENEFFSFEEEGLAFGIEYIGNIDAMNNFYRTSRLYLRPTLDKNKSKYYKAKTFIKYPLLNDIGLKPINDIINSNLPKGFKPNFDRNLAISFELSK